MDNFKAGMIGGWLTGMKGTEVFNDDGAGGGHIYIPRHTNIKGGRKVSVMRGWQYQPNSGSDHFPGFARRVVRLVPRKELHALHRGGGVASERASGR